MPKKALFVLFVFAFLAGLAAPGYAQRQTGSIHETVMDKDKNPLPGATVTISGAAVMGTRAYVTSETGVFRFAALLPGEYDVRTEMPGFKTQVRKGILVSVGQTAEVDVQLDQTTVEEEVTVVAKSPMVDIQTSKLSVNYSAKFLTSIPMNRDLYDIQNSIPGAISEGVDYRRTSSILGGTVRSQLYALDGVPMNDPATFYSMANINVDVYDEIEFEIGAHPAEVGQTDSTYINIVTKSGGNKFSGGGTFYYTSKGLAQDMFSTEQLKALNVNPPEKFTGYEDISFNLGGPIKTDKAWFFANGRGLWWDQAYPETPEVRMAKLGFTTSPHYDLSHTEYMGFGKLTFQLSNKVRYMGMLHYNHIYEPVYSNSTGTAWSFEATEVWDHENTFTTTHQFNLIFNQNTFADIRGTYIWRFFPIHSRNDGQYTYYDNQEKVYWGTSEYNDEYIRKKYLASASLTRFQDDFLGANHEFKGGVEFEQSEYHRDWYRPNPYYSYYNNYAAGDPYFYSVSSSRGRLRLRACPPERGMWDVQDHVRRLSAYLQDSFITGRLAVNVGLRFDWSYQYEPDQSRPALRYDYAPPFMNPAVSNPNALILALTQQFHDQGLIAPFDELATPWRKVVEFTTLSPRIGLSYDVFGDGTTALKLSFARYYEPIWSAKYNGGQIFGAATANFYWNDLNKNKLMDLPPTDSYEATSIPNQNPAFSYYGSDLKPPYMHEFMAGIEREVMKDFKVGFEFIYKVNKNIVEDWDRANGYDINATDGLGPIWLPFTFTDPGWDRVFDTADDNTLTAYGLRADRPAPTWMGGNPPEAERTYWSAILTFDKRMSNNWQVKGSVLYSEFKGNADPGYSATEGESGMFDNPNTLVNGYGRLGFDRPLQIKVMTSYVLPMNFVVSAYFQYRSGSAWERTLARVYFPKNYMGYGTRDSYYFLNAEPLGTERNAPYTNLDLRVEKSFNLGRLGTFEVYCDIFNLGGRGGVNVNQNPAAYLRYDNYPDKTAAAYVLSTTYGQITSIYGVRSIRFGARLGF